MILGGPNLPKYHMLLNITPKVILHDIDVALFSPTHLNNHIAPKMINDYIFVYSLVLFTSTLDYNFHTT